MNGRDPYGELAAALARLTGFPVVAPLGGGLGPVTRLLASSFPGDGKRVATNLNLPALFRAAGVIAVPPGAGAPELLAPPGAACAGPLPDPPPAPPPGVRRIFLLPDPADLPVAERAARLRALKGACAGFAWSGMLSRRRPCGFLTLADEGFARELIALGPQGGELPDYGVGLEMRCGEMLSLWAGEPAPAPPALSVDPLPEELFPWA